MAPLHGQAPLWLRRQHRLCPGGTDLAERSCIRRCNIVARCRLRARGSQPRCFTPLVSRLVSANTLIRPQCIAVAAAGAKILILPITISSLLSVIRIIIAPSRPLTAWLIVSCFRQRPVAALCSLELRRALF